MSWGTDTRNPPSYKSHKKEVFNKKLEKARQLKTSISEVSLLPEDKGTLLVEIAKIFAI